MTRGAHNVHSLGATLRRLEREAAAGTCYIHPERQAVGFIARWDNRPKGCCRACAAYGSTHGWTVHPSEIEDECDDDD